MKHCGKYPCIRELRSDNKSGYCPEHFYLSQNAKDSKKRYNKREYKKYKPAFESYRYKKYGLTLQEYETLVEKQQGLCAICKQLPNMERERLSVDHCHRTGVVRGLLCSSCNLLLGQAEDRIDVLCDAAVYLRLSEKKLRDQGEKACHDGTDDEQDDLFKKVGPLDVGVE